MTAALREIALVGSLQLDTYDRKHVGMEARRKAGWTSLRIDKETAAKLTELARRIPQLLYDEDTWSARQPLKLVELLTLIASADPRIRDMHACPDPAAHAAIGANSGSDAMHANPRVGRTRLVEVNGDHWVAVHDEAVIWGIGATYDEANADAQLQPGRPTCLMVTRMSHELRALVELKGGECGFAWTDDQELLVAPIGVNSKSDAMHAKPAGGEKSRRRTVHAKGDRTPAKKHARMPAKKHAPAARSRSSKRGRK